MTHICVSKLTIIGSDNGLLPGRHQAIIWSNAGILLIKPLGTNFNEMRIEILTFSFKKLHLKMSGKWRPFCLGLNVLTLVDWVPSVLSHGCVYRQTKRHGRLRQTDRQADRQQSKFNWKPNPLFMLPADSCLSVVQLAASRRSCLSLFTRYQVIHYCREKQAACWHK